MAPRRKKQTDASSEAATASVAVATPPLGTPLDGPGEPLRVTAEIAGAIATPWGPIALDALLAWAVCALEGFSSPVDEIREVDIPVAREPGGRFHLASFSEAEVEQHELRWLNRRFPIPEAQGLAVRDFKRINISAGAQKTYRLPMETSFLRDDRLVWHVLGDRARVADLLALVTHLGKRRGVGLGMVRRWTVEPCEPWPGFPVLRDGLPLRPLPADWPGVVGGDRAYRRLSYPYWLARGQVLCASPERASDAA